MTYLMLAVLLSSMGQPQPADPRAGIAIAKRLVAAIEGRAKFQSADFAKPLGESDKTALRRFATCAVDKIDYMYVSDPRRPNEYDQDLDHVTVTFACKGVPQSTPVGISLHLENGKVATVETHNADLMKVN